ncbi:DUF927 domain-containing protein [Pseudidiomarina sp. 1ASP75-14]|uniref:DUF927 domain-containing protein n=1 Tax=Pseudidiomarina terrestris TaxID=2820060 RepID=UPI0026561A2F|nr:DUF927 domain-containing protein [Pseudidiomarina sp. 1ASP75-14]MDN7137895.1 DUF927 domain-containing protein [Pseudidiomarina sp. 1ASP75-14]
MATTKLFAPENTLDLSPEQQARLFVDLINPTGPRCFRMLSPKSALEKRPALNRIFAPKKWQVGSHGESLYDILKSLNERGLAVYMTVNPVEREYAKENRFSGVANQHIVGVSALFLDFDQPHAISLEAIDAMSLPPSIVVETSPGKYHCYWLLESRGVISLAEFTPFQIALQNKFTELQPDVSIKDLARIMRVPGFIHSPEIGKNENRFISRLVRLNETRYSRQEILDFIGDVLCKPEQEAEFESRSKPEDNFDQTFNYQGEIGRRLLERLESAAKFLISETDYCSDNATFEELAAVFSNFQRTSNEEASEELFEELCLSAPGSTGNELERMKSFAVGYTGAKVTEGSLFKRAADAGWLNPVKVYSPGFQIEADGVYRDVKQHDDGGTVRIKICNQCFIKAWTESRQSGKGGFVLSFRTLSGKLVTRVYDRSLLHEPRDLVKRLESDGLSVTPGEQNAVAKYLGGFKTNKIAHTTSQVGWFDACFVLPDETLKPQECEDEVIFSSNEEAVPLFVSGSLDDWREKVGRVCIGNPVLAFSASVAFAAPLLEIVGQDGGGFHLFGASSKGKSTALQVAASIYGKPSSGGPSLHPTYLQTWRQTDNSIEVSLARYNNLLLPLDDMRQIRNAQALIDTIMMLGNNQGKGRANKNGDAQSKRNFRTLVLSTGEKPTQAFIEAENKPFDAGTEVRLPNIDIVFRTGVVHDASMFDDNHKEMIEHLKANTCRLCGAAGLQWLKWLVEHRDGLERKIKSRMERFVSEISEKVGPLGSQQLRVIDRFALVAAAGELATDCGITGWSKDEAFNAAIFMAKRYFEQRGTMEDTESQRIMARLYSTLIAQPKRFPYPYASSRIPAYMSQENVVGQLGYRLPKDETAFLNYLNGRMGEDFSDDAVDPAAEFDLGVYYLIPDPETLRSLLDNEYSAAQILAALRENGCLVTQSEMRDGKRRQVNKKKFASTSTKNFGAKQRSFYVIDLDTIDNAEE